MDKAATWLSFYQPPFIFICNQAKQCGGGCSEIDVAATWIFQRKFVPYPYYIRTISPYLYDIRTISVRYPKRTSAVRPYGVCTASVRRLYGVFTVFVRYLAVHPPYIRLMGCTDPFPLFFCRSESGFLRRKETDRIFIFSLILLAR